MAYVNVAEWKTEQVCEWLKGLDNCIQNYLHTFVTHNITGQNLLNFRPEDLENLGIIKIGHQEIILAAVDDLRNFHYELNRENLQLLALRLSCKAHSLCNELAQYSNTDKLITTQTLCDVATTVTSIKPLVWWMDKPPFNSLLDYNEKKRRLLKLSIEMATCAQRDRFAEKPIEKIQTACKEITELADYIIQESMDPMILQPATLDLATLKKPGDDLGFYIHPSFHVHQITEIKFGLPAHQSGKMEEGDEIVQVNYQTVVAWERKNVMDLFRENQDEIILTLKRRPRHTKVYGQIYIKPYRLPSNKKKSYSRWHHNLPSPRPELLTIPDFVMPKPRRQIREPSPEPVNINDKVDIPVITTDSSDSEDSESEPIIVERLYPSKPRNTIQRRATITGASPSSKYGVELEKFWRELKKEHKTAFPLLDKAISCAQGLDEAPQAGMRPQTYAGYEPNIMKPSAPKSEKRKVQIIEPERRSDRRRVIDESENATKVRLEGSLKFVNGNESKSRPVENVTEKLNYKLNENDQSETTEKQIPNKSKPAENVPENREEENCQAKTSEKQILNKPKPAENVLERVHDKQEENDQLRITENIMIFRNKSRQNLSEKALYKQEENIALKTPGSPVRKVMNKFHNNVQEDMSNKPPKIPEKTPEKAQVFEKLHCTIEKPENNTEQLHNTLEKCSIMTDKISKPPSKSQCCENNQLERPPKPPEKVQSYPEKAQNVEESTFRFFPSIFKKNDKTYPEVEIVTIKRNDNNDENTDNCNKILQTFERPSRTAMSSFGGDNGKETAIWYTFSPEPEKKVRLTPPEPPKRRYFSKSGLSSSDDEDKSPPPFPSRRLNNSHSNISNSSTSSTASNGVLVDRHLWTRKPEKNFAVESLSEPRNSKPKVVQRTLLEQYKTMGEGQKHIGHSYKMDRFNTESSLQNPATLTRPTEFLNTSKVEEKEKSSEMGTMNRAISMARNIALHGNTGSYSGKSPRSARKRNMLLTKRRNLSVKDLNPVDMEGWLTYRGKGAGGTWVKAWYALKYAFLYRFATQDSLKADCLICLTGYTVSQAPEIKSRKYAFKVYHTGTVFYFAADSEDLLSTWLDAVNKATLGIEASQGSSELYSETDESDSETKNSNQKSKSPPPSAEKSGSSSSESGFGSLKKFVRRDGTSLDRKYLKFLGSKSRNYPVPTEQFRSYRRVLPSSSSSLNS